jgi:hypothetical protein
MGPSFRDQGSAMGDDGFAALERFFVQTGRIEVPVNGLKILQAKAIGAMRRVKASRLTHCFLHMGFPPGYPCL